MVVYSSGVSERVLPILLQSFAKYNFDIVNARVIRINAIRLESRPFEIKKFNSKIDDHVDNNYVKFSSSSIDFVNSCQKRRRSKNIFHCWDV